MKTNNLRSKSASIAKRRWSSYAAAGAATALAGSQSAEAAIHYSGHLRVPFRDGTRQAFPLAPPASFSLAHFGSADFFILSGLFSYSVRGVNHFGPVYVSKLSAGVNVSTGNFASAYSGILARGESGNWTDPGKGFIGFSFNTGDGVQYGWARISTTGFPNLNFRLLDYAYADPGEPIRAGQKSSHGQAPDQGSLGWLALGAVGLLAWRKSRSRPAR